MGINRTSAASSGVVSRRGGTQEEATVNKTGRLSFTFLEKLLTERVPNFSNFMTMESHHHI